MVAVAGGRAQFTTLVIFHDIATRRIRAIGSGGNGDHVFEDGFLHRSALPTRETVFEFIELGHDHTPQALLISSIYLSN